jgi:hypothetical protein
LECGLQAVRIREKYELKLALQTCHPAWRAEFFGRHSNPGKERYTMTFGSLFFWLFVGLAGTAYFVYGKKQQEFWFMGAGLGLMFFPMLGLPALAELAVAAILLALPFGAQRWL